MKIGNLTINGNVFLAPMAGVTDKAFRDICREFGAVFTYSEMVSAKGVFYGNENSEILLGAADEFLAVQIFGREVKSLVYAAQKAEAAGAALVDINMGCPAPKIVRNGEGAALLREPDLIGEIVENVARAVSVPVSVKIRKGFTQNTAVQTAKIAESAGAAAIAVHGRTRDMFYAGESDWDVIKEVKQNVSIPVIGNGDVLSMAHALERIEESGCDAVMIGRAALGNPFLFRGLVKADLSADIIIDTAVRHAKLLVLNKGERTGIREMRKHAAWYIKGLPNAARLKVLVNTAQTLEEITEILNKL
ncbi:tRNA-dihydrouridine synthase [Clostridia bacterium]|nr:tRNA-dihydrouridine synthase [Clostridia bacterium]